LTIQDIIGLIPIVGLGLTIRSMLYPLRKAYHAARFADPRRRGPALWWAAWSQISKEGGLNRQPPPSLTPEEYTLLGEVRSHTVDGQTILVQCENANVQLTVLAPDLIRVALQRLGESLDAFSYAIAKPEEQWPPTPFKVRDVSQSLEIWTAKLVCCVSKSPCRIAFFDPSAGSDFERKDAPISADKEGLAWHSSEAACFRHLPSTEHVYGLGEKAFGLDRRGRTFEMWNDDPHAYPPGTEPLYLNIPLFIGLRGEKAYGLFFDNTYRSWLDLGASAPDTLAFRATGGSLCYYFFYGPQVSTVLERYTEMTGRMQLPPLWALGYQQSRWSYMTEARVREIAREFRARRIPCEAIHLDIHYMDGYRCFTWDRQRFPDPARMMADLRADGFKIVPIIDCGIKADRNYSVCRDGMAQAMFCKYPDGTLYSGPVWPGECHFPDFTSPRVREWWGKQYCSLVEMGMEGVWNDMNEPTAMGWAGDTFPDCVRHDWEGRGCDHARAHNIYGMQMARATAEGLQALRPDRRTFVLTRSGWAGLQRYAMNWTGDNQSTWEHLRLTMPMVANLGLSGLAFTGADVGGFGGTPNGELLTRWIQLGVFTPFFRNHTALNTSDQEPWRHGEPYESINRRYIELRYQLLPYIYTAFWQCAQTGLPMLRPLFLGWQNDPHTYTLEDEFMFGDALLIAPVSHPSQESPRPSEEDLRPSEEDLRPSATQRDVYLPEGTWYDWSPIPEVGWSSKCYAGPQTISIKAPLDQLPIFVRAGSVIPAWPIMQYIGQQPVDVLTLHVFPGSGQSVLYEDDGESLEYQSGEFRVTRFSMQSNSNALTIQRTTQGPFEPTCTRVEIVVYSASGPRSVSADGLSVKDWRFDEATQTLHIRAPLAHMYHIQPSLAH
jgi:alpha-glucosidase